jgi:hypothetical protein
MKDGIKPSDQKLAEKPVARFAGWMVMLAIGGLFVVYFPIALWLKNSHVPPDAPAGAVWRLTYFRKFSGVGYISQASQFYGISDTNTSMQRSPLILYEDGKPLGPAHSMHDDISNLGNGRFSHWGTAFFLSTSDNSDPSTNGREYWAVAQ